MRSEGEAANRYNGREKSGKKKGAQPGHKGNTLTKKAIRAGIEKGDYEHKVVSHGGRRGIPRVKIVVDIRFLPIVTEHLFYPDQNGNYNIPKELRNGVTYG
jgi:hypothetical protein